MKDKLDKVLRRTIAALKDRATLLDAAIQALKELETREEKRCGKETGNAE